MRVKILIEFVVPEAEDEATAKAAASLAAHDYLTFCEVSGYNTDTESVTVHVDGRGEYEVRVGDVHG